MEYDSKSVGVRRKAVVSTPPGDSKEVNDPVRHLLLGIGGTEEEWTSKGSAEDILGNLPAGGKMVVMVVVMPNGRAAK